MTNEGFKTAIALCSAVIIPVVLAFLGNNYTQAVKEREIQAQFVKIAIEILQAEPSPHNRNVREWATQIINRYSGVPLSTEAKRDLIDSIQITASGLSEEEIKNIQQGLAALGLYRGAIIGVVDSDTTSAIKEFQKNRGMAADGIPGPATRRELLEAQHKNP